MSTSPDESFWRAMRARMRLDPHSVNLNAGTLSPTPNSVLERLTQLRGQLAAAPSDFLWRKSGPLLARSRSALAQYLHCNPRELLLIPNATFGVNLVVGSLSLGPGDEVLATDHEYGAMMLCWRACARQRGFDVREVELPFRAEDPAQIVATFEREIRPATKVLYFSHVTTSTGLVLPAREICALARRRGIISIVDGAHGPGMVPVNLNDIGADFYTANCHKWLMAPAGAGFLHARSERRAMLKPLIISWGHGYDAAAGDEPGPEELGTRWQCDLEFHGTLDRTPQMVIADAIKFRAELGGEDAIRARVRAIAAYARQLIASCGFASATPANPQMSGSLLAFDYPCDDPRAARERIWNEHRIECPVTSAAGKTFLRVSIGWFTLHDEIDRLVEALHPR